MIKVTLLGDSIRMIGYGRVVPTLLGENFDVFQPNENCRFAKYTLRGLFDWEKGIIINDLYQLVSSDVDKYIRKDDNIHLSDEGIKVCAEQVADIVRKVSQTLGQNSKGKLNSFIDNISFIGAPI